MSGADRRMQQRLSLAIPLRVQGYFHSGTTWDELSTTLDVSERGASFPLRHPIELGNVLRLSLGLPKRLRRFDLNEVTYTVYSLVRVVHRTGETARVGVLFFGKYPPRGFHEHPDGRYLLPGDAMPRPGPRPSPGAPVAASGVDRPTSAAPASPPPGSQPTAETATTATPPASVSGPSVSAFLPSDPPTTERRSSPRLDLFLNFVLQQTDGSGEVMKQELTVADNVARGGVRVMTTLAFQVGDVVQLQEAGGDFSARAEVRNITPGQAACERLHLRFVDCEAPDRLLR